MKVFITGGTGLIGSAVVAELLAHGHTAAVLARSDRSADAVIAAGAEVVRGDLADLVVLRAAADDADGVVHLAFRHDFSGPDGWAAATAEETAAVTAIGDALAGSDRPFAVVSGTPWIAGRPSTEADPLSLDGPTAGRARSVNATLALADRGVRSAAVRIPRTAHDHGRGGFAGLLTRRARETGVAGFPGDGTQRWPAVHAADAASLFRLVLEQAPAGTAWHAVGEEGVVVRDIAEVVGRRLGLPVRQVPKEDFGPLGDVFAMDQPSSSAHTRATLGWTPTHPDLLQDLELLEP